MKGRPTSDLDRDLARLLALGLIDRATLVEGGWRLSSLAGRHRNLRLEIRHRTDLFIKRATGQNRADLRAEAGIYAYCQGPARLADVAELMPRLHGFLAADHTLITEWITGGRNLFQELRAYPPSDLPTLPAAALGRALAVLHTAFRSQPPPEMSERPPRALAMHRPGVDILAGLSPANHEILKILQSQPDLIRRLDTLAAAWRRLTLIHGDIRSANVLIVAGERNARRVRLIDWELVRRGDPAWDAGSVLAELLYFWQLAMPLESELSPRERTRAAAYPLPVLKPLLRAFWRSYATAAGLEGREATELLARAVELSAVRLIRSAWELSLQAEKLSSLAVLLLQTGANVLAQPREATESLYGLGRFLDS